MDFLKSLAYGFDVDQDWHLVFRGVSVDYLASYFKLLIFKSSVQCVIVIRLVAMAGQISLLVKLLLPKKITAKESAASSSTSRRSVLPETTSSGSILSHVTQTQLVLALTIQKSRPDGITTKGMASITIQAPL